MRVLSHDAFARFEVLRQQVTGHTVDAVGGFGDRLYVCDECGRVNRTPKGKPFAYRYGTQSDGFGARVEWTEGVFCSKSCWHSAYTL